MNETYEPEHAIDPTPTQVAEPIQAAKRTVLQYIAGVLSALIVAGLVRVGLDVPGDVAQAVGVLVGAAVSWAAAWVMALPRINQGLTALGFGAIPKG